MPTTTKRRTNSRTTASTKKGSTDAWELRLYVAGQTPKSQTALANLKRLCDKYLAEGKQLQLQIIDLVEEPGLAEQDQIIAIPTLVRRLPPPVRRIIGDLSNNERVLVGLGLSEH